MNLSKTSQLNNQKGEFPCVSILPQKNVNKYVVNIKESGKK